MNPRTGVVEPAAEVGGARARVLALLAAGVPLSLLLDLADPAGPASAEIALRERPRTVVLPDVAVSAAP